MKAGAKTSMVWNFFQKNPDKKSVNCTICKKNLKFFGNTTNLKSHIERMHLTSVDFIQNESNSSTSKYTDRTEEVHQDDPATSIEAAVPECSSRFATDAGELCEDQPLRKKTKQSKDEELISLARKSLQQPMNEYDKISSAWAVELQKMTPQQQLFAKKAINEIMFEGQMGTLHRHSVQINTCSPTSTPNSIVVSSPVAPTTLHRTFQNTDSDSWLNSSSNLFESRSQIQSGCASDPLSYKNDDLEQQMKFKTELDPTTESE